jgi:hypothetical protein
MHLGQTGSVNVYEAARIIDVLTRRLSSQKWPSNARDDIGFISSSVPPAAVLLVVLSLAL